VTRLLDQRRADRRVCACQGSVWARAAV